jgi:hypothetical protein
VVSDVEALRKFARSLEEMIAVVEKARKSGRTLEQMKADKLLSPWASWNNGWIKQDDFIATIDQDLALAKK